MTALDRGLHTQSTSFLQISGLGGWLIFVQFGLYGTLIGLTVQLLAYNVPTFKPESWAEFTSPDSEYYHILWKPVIIYETVFVAALIALGVYALVTMYRRQRLFPALMIIWYGTGLVLGLIDGLLTHRIMTDIGVSDEGWIKDQLRAVFACVVWIPYFLRSVRVRNTFVR